VEQVCRVVHPEGQNLNTFGHEIRNLLILACTELEAYWKCILNANGVDGSSTNDYVKLSHAMRLPEYRVDFSYYPWLEPVAPFESWGSTGSPSQELEWYSAYNKTKHNRDASFAEATLLRAFKALAGCFVMLCAQYGSTFALKGDAAARAFLRLLDTPAWNPSDLYVPPYNTEWTQRKYF
jgi:hypothetical protein